MVGPLWSSWVVVVVEGLGTVVGGGDGGKVVATWPATSVTTVRLALTTMPCDGATVDEELGEVEGFTGAAGLAGVTAAPAGAGRRITVGEPLTGAWRMASVKPTTPTAAKIATSPTPHQGIRDAPRTPLAIAPS